MNKLLKKIFTEPLIQFLFLGMLLYLINIYVQKKSKSEELEINIDNDKISQILINYKTQTGSLPNKKQLDAIIENYIREEISYREARKMGLDKDDEIIRRRLIQKYDFLQTDLAEVSSPTDEELLKFYQDNSGDFKKEATINFSHIFFSTDNCSDSIAKQKAQAVLEQLQNTGIQHAPEKGDRFPLQYDYTDQTKLDIEQNFGNKPILHILFDTPVNTWAGPVQSGYGWHLVCVTKTVKASPIPFEQVKGEVKIKYAETKKAEQNKKLFEQLRDKFIINRAYLEANK
jgi:parvulin-like peptidyl-prolyl isomerase